MAKTRQSLGPAAQDRLDDELADLGLLKYCRTGRQGSDRTD
jgi:hypothetical protein